MRCERLAAIPEPVPPPPEIVAREITIAMQIAVLRGAWAAAGGSCCSSCWHLPIRTEAAVTLLATLELVRRRQVKVQQGELFGPIVVGSTDA